MFGSSYANHWTLFLITLLIASSGGHAIADTIAGHSVVLDNQGKILPWFSPATNAYDEFLDKRWNFIKNSVPMSPGPAPRSNYPQYYFYDGYVTTQKEITPDNWMNDIGEKIPNWLESARLYYAYTGDASVMTIVRNLIDYTIEHGTSPADFAWPNFPYTTTNFGETEFTGFTARFAKHEIQVDHAGDMGLSYFRMYQFTNETKYLTAALHTADVLAAKARIGTVSQSIWPYRVKMDTGEITAEYGANWTGCYALLDELIKSGLGNTRAYREAQSKARDFILNFPMKTGYWTDGHTDTDIKSNTYKSNLSKSNTALYMYDHPEFDPEWKKHLPMLIQWTEENFVYRTCEKEPATAYGANIVGEQDDFNFKMDYQTARYATECARWYQISGDKNYLEKAYRSLNWVTYCSDENGRATESPYSPKIASWWSDCYGECPRMFYPAFAAVPEWAPPQENHILYSAGILTDVVYTSDSVKYSVCDPTGTEYLRLRFLPSKITIADTVLPKTEGESIDGWTVRSLGGGDYAVTTHHSRKGEICIARESAVNMVPVLIDGKQTGQVIDGFGVNVNHRSWNKKELEPLFDAFINEAGMNLFRIVFDNTDWEAENDNDNPQVMNWDYYNKIYDSPDFIPLWEMAESLIQREPNNQVFLNFMGPGPAWMGGGTLTSGMEEEWAESIASLLVYARDKRGLHFRLLAPNNEPDINNEGISMDAAAYTKCLHHLVKMLDSNGLKDIQFIAPDRAGGGTGYLPEMVADPTVMAKVTHFGIHSYSKDGAGSTGVLDYIQKSIYPNRTFWMTEFNVWCNTCDSGQRGTYDWAYCRGTAEYLLRHLANGASGGIVWEGYDSYYKHPPSTWSFWGLFAADDENASEKTYTPRKNFYTIAQISKFIRPGARRISVNGDTAPFSPLLAFYHASLNQITLVGINPSSKSAELQGQLKSLPSVAKLNLFTTSNQTNMALSGNVSIHDGTFSIKIPEDCIFSLTNVDF